MMFCLGFFVGVAVMFGFLWLFSWSQPKIREAILETYEGDGYRRVGSAVFVGTPRPLSKDCELRPHASTGSSS